MFSEENYVPQPKIDWLVKHAYPNQPIIVSQCSIYKNGEKLAFISRDSMQKHKFGHNMTLQSTVVTLEIKVHGHQIQN